MGDDHRPDAGDDFGRTLDRVALVATARNLATFERVEEVVSGVDFVPFRNRVTPGPFWLFLESTPERARA
jgi:hypothetical protein